MKGLDVNLVTWLLSDIPNTSLLVVRARKEKSFLDRVPSQSVTLLVMALEFHIWLDLIICRDFWVLIVIKDVDVPTGGLCGDYFLILWHVSSFVHFTRMVDLDIDRNSSLLILGDTISADPVCVIIARIFFVIACVLG
jgi:hypothetical protein